ncbi:hypothetical protein ACHAXR_009652 [Thalassiosira sp. AJA248-18]
MSTTNDETHDGIPSHWPVISSRWDAAPASEEQDNTSDVLSEEQGAGGGHTKHRNMEPISLAVAADVAQVQIPENSQNHARGGAVAQRLRSMLSHVSSNDHFLMALDAELSDCPAAAATITTKHDAANNADHDQQQLDDKKLENDHFLMALNSELSGNPAATTKHKSPTNADHDHQQLDNTKMAGSSSPPSPQKEFGFKRVIHAIDNYLHPPSKLLSHVHFPSPRHHLQGHRLNSMNSVGASNHACNMSCLPNCSHLQQQQQDLQQQQQQQQQQTDNKPHVSQQNSSPGNSTRRLPIITSLSTTVASFASNLSTHSHNNSQAAKPKQSSRPFFSFSLHSGSRQQPTGKRSSPRFKGPLLYNCSDHDEHEAVITTAQHVCNLYHLGHDVNRTVHRQNGSDRGSGDGDDRENTLTGSEDEEDTKFEKREGKRNKSKRNDFDCRARHALSSLGFEFRLDVCKCCGGNDQTDDNKCKTDTEGDSHRCSNCVTRLYHIPSNTAVTKDNRRTFVADGKMYDAIADLCQAAAQEIMAQTCDLVWVTMCDGKGGGRNVQYQQVSQSKPRSNSIEEWPRDENGNIVIQEPIRALVGRQPRGIDAKQPHDTFLVATGKGKVRAGIFSREHLLTTGLEPSTALPLLREAQDRGMNCVVIDPNARGDRHGMDTFELSIRSLFEGRNVLEEEEVSEEEEDDDSETRAIIPADVNGPIYVLAHSAAGGQLVRYLLDQQKGAPLLSRIRCITFTDSTHSVQWLKSHPHISSLIQSSKALYVRSANPMRDDDWERASPGDECPKDHFWSHRFGEIKTVWAGTTEHSLSNWTAQKPIWDHFDSVRGQTGETPGGSIDEEGNENVSCSSRRIGSDHVDSIGNKKGTNGTVETLNNGSTGAHEEPLHKERPHQFGTKPVVI